MTETSDNTVQIKLSKRTGIEHTVWVTWGPAHPDWAWVRSVPGSHWIG